MKHDLERTTRLLQEPFSPEDLEWRTQQCGISKNGKPWAIVVPYITNRAIQQRLDDVVGFDSWRNEYKPTPHGKGYLCGLSIRISNPGGTWEWITKWDGAEHTNIEPLKGALSKSMKRSAVQWGMGRYLYNLEQYFAICNLANSRYDCADNHAEDKNTGQHINWAAPDLPAWALPGVITEDYVDNIRSSDTFDELKEIYAGAYLYAKSFGMADFKEVIGNEYKAKKAELDKIAYDNTALAYAKVEEWLDKQIATLEFIPEASSVIIVGDTFKTKLLKKSEGEYFDNKPLIAKLHRAVEARTTNITIPTTPQ